MSKRDTPLQATYDDGELVIRVGVDQLASAIARGDKFHHFDGAKGEYIRDFAISNTEEFAREVAIQMQLEKEDGSSQLSDFLEEMAQRAIEDGSVAVEHDQQILYGKKHPLETW